MSGKVVRVERRSTEGSIDVLRIRKAFARMKANQDMQDGLPPPSAAIQKEREGFAFADIFVSQYRKLDKPSRKQFLRLAEACADIGATHESFFDLYHLGDSLYRSGNISIPLLLQKGRNEKMQNRFNEIRQYIKTQIEHYNMTHSNTNVVVNRFEIKPSRIEIGYSTHKRPQRAKAL